MPRFLVIQNFWNSRIVRIDRSPQGICAVRLLAQYPCYTFQHTMLVKVPCYKTIDVNTLRLLTYLDMKIQLDRCTLHGFPAFPDRLQHRVQLSNASLMALVHLSLRQHPKSSYIINLKETGTSLKELNLCSRNKKCIFRVDDALMLSNHWSNKLIWTIPIPATYFCKAPVVWGTKLVHARCSLQLWESVCVLVYG